MSKKRESISALFEPQGPYVKARVLLVRDDDLGKGSSAGHLKRQHQSLRLRAATRGFDAELRTLCRRGVIPA